MSSAKDNPEAGVRGQQDTSAQGGGKPLLWLAGGPGAGGEVRILAKRTAGDPGGHSEGCEAMRLRPGMFCGAVATIGRADPSADRRSVTLEWAPTWYCNTFAPDDRQDMARRETFGWNVVVTFEEGGRVVVMRRARTTLLGGLWSVSANEGVEPADMPEGTAVAAVDAASVTLRSIREELGVRPGRSLLEAASSTVGVFKVPGAAGYGALVAIDADLLGVEQRSLSDRQRSAEGAQEGTVEIQPTLRLSGLGRSWTPWSLECLNLAAEHVRSSRERRQRL